MFSSRVAVSISFAKNNKRGVIYLKLYILCQKWDKTAGAQGALRVRTRLNYISHLEINYRHSISHKALSVKGFVLSVGITRLTRRLSIP